MNPAELYTQLATQAPKRETPVVEPEFEMPELNDAEKQNLANFAESVYKQYEDLPMAQQLGLAVAPGTNATATHPGGDKIATFTVSGTLTIT